MITTKAYRVKIESIEGILTTKREVLKVLNGALIDDKIEITITCVRWEDAEFNSLEKEYRKELFNEIIFD
ncbi:MAG TPA: hypothetical protein VEF33_12280 [Syntrophales bacterium]|nr:hypothetical protein [Syntrophales bacterium]